MLGLMNPTHTDAGLACLSRLAGLLAAHAPSDGVFELAIPGVHAIRASQPNVEQLHGLQKAALCIIAQGAKTVVLGGDSYHYDPSHMMLFSVDLPVAGQVRRASVAEPYYCFRLDLDPVRIGELTRKVYPDGLPKVAESRAIFLARASDEVSGAAARLLELAQQPDQLALIAPLIIDEILIRLLRSSVGGRLAQIGHADSHVHRVSRAVRWVREHFAQPMRVEELAARVHMSPSSLHLHFKAVTSMSPLQFQKTMRLQEARRLILGGGIDAAGAGQAVGYLSASQFSREYTRFFGNPPLRDITRLRPLASDHASTCAR